MTIEETLRTIVREELTAVLQKLRKEHQGAPESEAAPEVTKPTPAPKAKAKPKAKEEPKVEPAFDEEDAAAEPLPMEDDEFDAPAEVKTKVVASAIELLAEVKAFCEEHDCSAEAKKVIAELGYAKFSAVPDDKAQEIYDATIKALSK